MDLWVSEIVSDWDLENSVAYPVVWLVTQLGGRVTILVVLAVLVGHLAWRRRTWLPLVRVLVALALLTLAVYAVKHGTGRTAPAFPGSFFFHEDGASFPSGHVANAVLMWGVARWLAAEYGLPARVQHAFWLLHVLGPLATAVAMVSLDFHWVTDAVVGCRRGRVAVGRGSHTRCIGSVTLGACPSRPAVRVAAFGADADGGGLPRRSRRPRFRRARAGRGGRCIRAGRGAPSTRCQISDDRARGAVRAGRGRGPGAGGQ